MSDIQEDIITKEKDADYTDLESLLEAAKLSEFTPEAGYTEENQDFVKFESFFEIVKSTETAEVDVQEKNEVQKFDEVIADAPQKISEQEPLDDGTEMDLVKSMEETEEDLSSKIEEDLAGETPNDDEMNNIQDEKSTEEPIPQKEAYSATSDDQSEDMPDTLDAEIDETILSEDIFDSEIEKSAYERGHRAALEEFEKSMDLEKQSLQQLTETLFSISDKFQQETESLIMRKLRELLDELIGAKIKEFQEPFIKKIKLAADDIIATSTEISLELNRYDLKVLKANTELKSFGFEIFGNDELRRGEFKIIKNSSGFQQKIIE